MTDIHTVAKDFSALQVTEEDGYIIARMNRPEVRNAIDETMVEEFHTLCGFLERDPQILVITGCVAETSKGQRGIFASGADIAQLRERRREDKLPSPVIAAIDGFALGGGLELALAADFRIATPGAKFGQPEANLGIIAGAGALWRLKEAVGNPLAKEILLTGRVLTGEEAAQSHLVNELFEPEALEDGAREWAKKIAALDPLAVRLSKQLFDMPVEAHPAIDNIAQAVLFESEAKFDRMQAFLDRKKK